MNDASHSPLLRACRWAALFALGFATAGASAAEPTTENALLAGMRRNLPVDRALFTRENAAAQDTRGNTALHWAALNHNAAGVRALLAAGAEPDTVNAAGATPLVYGAGNAEIVGALLARGANPNAVTKEKTTPLMVAAAHPASYAVVKALIEAGADIHAKRTSDIEVVLPRAVNAGDRRTIDLLLERGAARDKNSVSTALSLAAGSGDTEVVARLLSQGADPNYVGSMAGHALNTALLCEQLEVARQLIEAGADVNLRSPRGHATPPIVWAAYNQRGDESVARALLARGADLQATNEHNASAIGYALRSGATPLVTYLQEQGAKPPLAARVKNLPARSVPESAAARAELVRERLPATLALLQRSSDAFLANGFVRKANCTSCHGQDLPAVVYEAARARGFAIDDASLGRQLAAQLARWNERAENARQMTSPLPGEPVTLAYGLFGLRASGYGADEMTDAMVRYMMRTQRPSGEWADFIRRPPMEDGVLVAAAWVALSVRDYAPAALEAEAKQVLQRAADWLRRQRPANHNETVFQLLGLHWSKVARGELGKYVAAVTRSQRTDGGWAQLPGLESDAWATATALYALHEAAGMRTDEPVYQRGVAYLLRTQYEDGSWWVRSRSWPFQPQFDGQFPHGRDQWISQGATAWAALALLFTLEPVPNAPRPPDVRELVARHGGAREVGRSNAVKGAHEEATASAGPVFARDIQPIFERSCAGCHGGEKPRAGLSVASRETLLKGGASGEPAIVPGRSGDSLLLHYVAGKIEDLEMPPLDRREKYPALKEEEVALLRSWIDAGAPGRAAAGQ